MQFELLKTRREVQAFSAQVASLIDAAAPRPDATHTVEYFLAGLAPGAGPRLVACRESGRLVGVLYTWELHICGLATGFAFGGDLMGRGLLLAEPAREQEIFAGATAFLIRQGLHGMRLHWTPGQPLNGDFLASPVQNVRYQRRQDDHAEGDWLRLQSTYEGFLSSLGPHTRRNLRYYRRKVEAAGYCYTGVLGPDKLTHALQCLNRLADYPMDQARLDRDRSYFKAFGTPVIAGLRDGQGRFISLITAFTAGTDLHVLTQLNGENAALRKLSLSLVLRGYVIEEFIARGFTAVHFIQGSSPMLGRFCEPVQMQVVSIDDRTAWMTPFKKACSSLADVFRWTGMRVPYRLQRAAGSYLQ